MNQIYVLLGGLLWRLWGKHVSLWYAHGHVSWDLYIAVQMVHRIFTTSEKSFRIPSSKRVFMGQAIDVDIFCVDRSSRRADVITLVSVGRIAPVKNTQMLIDMTQQLLGEDYDVQLVLVGGPGSAKEIIYEKELQEYVKNHHLEKHVHFAGGLAHGEITPYLQSAHVFVSGSQTGSLDKAILEAMACGTPVVACNDSFCDIAAQAQYPKLLFDGTFDDLLKKMKGLLNKHQHERDVMGERLREIVVREHALVPFMDRLIEHLYG